MKEYRKRIADDILARKLEEKALFLLKVRSGVERQLQQNKLLPVSCIWMTLKRKSRIFQCLN